MTLVYFPDLAIRGFVDLSEKAPTEAETTSCSNPFTTGNVRLAHRSSSQAQAALSSSKQNDTTIGHIRYAVNALRPTPLRRGENPPDDRHWMKLKRFRLSGLNQIFDLKEGIVDLTLGKVDEMIRRLQGSELDLLQDDWAEQKDRLDSEIEKLYSLVYPTSHLQETNGRKKPPNPLVSHLGQIALPVVKLARTFINKISRRGINTKGCPLYTEMVSADLVTLSRLAEEVATWVGGITTCVRQAATYHMGHKAQKLKECLQTSLSLINEYILPLLPDTKDLPDQTLLKTWLATWSTHFDLAVKTLKMIDADR
ncbi:hypothetical protein PSHT_11855 [Puccinia striiformis]|uniref:Uncharacterized protein n=1 Tax=Puccinia striiformis TaxID=27350 RepID=A0A2S4V0L8_9BASI|nr:hypothetical protein PSHT_11855 [Puccinia striiformis]